MRLASEDAWVYLCSTLRTVTKSHICYTWWGAADIDVVLLPGLAARIGETNPLAGAAPPPWAAARPCRYSGHWQWPSGRRRRCRRCRRHCRPCGLDQCLVRCPCATSYCRRYHRCSRGIGSWRCSFYFLSCAAAVMSVPSLAITDAAVVSQTPFQAAFAAATACGVKQGCCPSCGQASASTAAAAVHYWCCCCCC